MTNKAGEQAEHRHGHRAQRSRSRRLHQRRRLDARRRDDVRRRRMRHAARRRGLHADRPTGREGREVSRCRRRHGQGPARLPLATAARGDREGVQGQAAGVQAEPPDARQLGRRRSRDHPPGDLQEAAQRRSSRSGRAVALVVVWASGNGVTEGRLSCGARGCGRRGTASLRRSGRGARGGCGRRRTDCTRRSGRGVVVAPCGVGSGVAESPGRVRMEAVTSQARPTPPIAASSPPHAGRTATHLTARAARDVTSPCDRVKE